MKSSVCPGRSSLPPFVQYSSQHSSRWATRRRTRENRPACNLKLASCATAARPGFPRSQGPRQATSRPYQAYKRRTVEAPPYDTVLVVLQNVKTTKLRLVYFGQTQRTSACDHEAKGTQTVREEVSTEAPRFFLDLVIGLSHVDP